MLNMDYSTYTSKTETLCRVQKKIIPMSKFRLYTEHTKPLFIVSNCLKFSKYKRLSIISLIILKPLSLFIVNSLKGIFACVFSPIFVKSFPISLRALAYSNAYSTTLLAHFITNSHIHEHSARKFYSITLERIIPISSRLHNLYMQVVFTP